MVWSCVDETDFTSTTDLVSGCSNTLEFLRVTDYLSGVFVSVLIPDRYLTTAFRLVHSNSA